MSFDYCEWEKGGCFKYLCLYIVAHTNYIKRTLQLFQEIHSSGWNIPYVLNTYTQRGALRQLLGRLPVVPRYWWTYGAFHPWLTFPSFHCFLQQLDHLLNVVLRSKEMQSLPISISQHNTHVCISFFLPKVISSLYNILYLAIHTHD